MRAIPCKIDEVLSACQDMIDRFSYEGGKMWPETERAIRAAPYEGAENLRRTLNAGELMRNAAHCLVCDEIIESTWRHDFKTCTCGSVSVDGGTWYARRVGEPENYENLIDRWPWL